MHSWTPILRRLCLGLTVLGERFGQDRLEAACRRALGIGGALCYRSVRSILERGLDRDGDEPAAVVVLPQVHENLRGRSYYGGAEEKPC